MEVSNIRSADAARPSGPSGSSSNEATIKDKRGRTLKVRKIGPLQRTRLFKLMGPDNSRNIPLLGHYQMAVSVIEIDGIAHAFPTTELQIEAMIERLDEDGLEAVAEAWRANKWIDIDAGNPDNIKN